MLLTIILQQYATNSSAAASHSGQGSHSGGAKVPRIVPGSDRSPALSKPAKEPVQAKLTIEALEHLRIATGPESAHAASRTGHFVKHGGFASTAASEAGKSTISNAGQRYNLAQQGPNSNSQSRGPGYTGWDSSGQPHERTQAPPASVQSTVTVLTRPKVDEGT